MIDMRELLEELGKFIIRQETIEGKVYECLNEAIAYIENQMRYTMPDDSEKVEYLNYIKEHLFDTKTDEYGETVYRYLGTWGMGNYILGNALGQPLLFNAIDKRIREYASLNNVDCTNNLPNPQTYTKELLQLFKGRVELITELKGLSNNEIASKIKEWAKSRDKLGKPLIENPGNGLKSKYAQCLKENGLITESESNFRKKL